MIHQKKTSFWTWTKKSQCITNSDAVYDDDDDDNDNDDEWPVVAQDDDDENKYIYIKVAILNTPNRRNAKID